MIRQRSFAAVLAALVLFSSWPTLPARAAEPRDSEAPSASATVATVAPLPAVATNDDRFGMVQGIGAPDLAYHAGARWDRVIFPWSLIQKDGPNSWTELYYTDEAIKAQVRRGVTMAGVMIYTPQWASINPTYGRPVDKPQGLDLPYNDPRNTWGQFVRKLAARHKGTVDHWYVWNEPDMFSMEIRYTWDSSYEDYAQLLKVAYLNIKEVNPDAKVITGGLAYWWDKEHERPPYLGPLIEVLKNDPEAARNNHYFDIVSTHTYANPLNSFAQPLIMREILELRGIKKPIWISESNVIPFDDPANPLPAGYMRASLSQQASYIVQAMAMAVAANVERYAVYKATDEKAENDIELWGLLRNDLTAKPSYVAYQVGATYFSNVKSAVFRWPGVARPTWQQYKQILDSNARRTQFIWPAQVAEVVMERGDRRTTVVWNTSPSEVTHKVEATAKQATLVTKDGKTQTIRPTNGFYSLDLAPTHHNADPRDSGIYLIGGDPFIIDEQVKPLPTDRVASRIEMVWPHGSAPVEEADRANVTAQLLMPGTLEAVPCRYSPETPVQLFAWKDGGKEKIFLGDGVGRVATEGGLSYLVWDFNGVDVSYAKEEGKSLELFVVVEGVKTDPQPWIYGGEKNQDWTLPRVRPAKSCE
ncbi:MAG: hypothetical protein M3O34_07575 [Chloroflexota bacterium]|nr:hypothetical protein [Chloroflexota bacterium]